MHTIRLRGPWEFSIRGTQVAGRIQFPCTWRELAAAMGARAGDRPLTFVRRFNKPTGLEVGDSVLLSLSACGTIPRAQLGDIELILTERPDGSLQADITAALAARNDLVVELAPPSPPLPGSDQTVLEATLEIHPAS